MSARSETVLIEACVDSVASAVAAVEGGAGRLELCDSLCDGGTTPSAGMIATVKTRVEVPVFVIIRPRGGGFLYSTDELAVMRRDIDMVKQLGADGLVFGALRPDARIDTDHMALLLDVSGSTPVTFHRAFDFTPDLDESLDTLGALGIVRVLTSGGAPTAARGAERLASLVVRADGHLTVMAGGGIHEDTIGDLVRLTGVRELHVRATRLARREMRSDHVRTRVRRPLPDDEAAWEETDADRVRRMVAAANDAARPPAFTSALGLNQVGAQRSAGS
ncbi:MAG TPA: copper homeostasis protein CutC [Gemmatimonadaceae bacterium]|nr:copper homeostasis protein CutC [Gemmatimonadaceae bacterium]